MRGQFFIIMAVLILIQLMTLASFMRSTTFSASNQPVDELEFLRDFARESNISDTLYLYRKDIKLLQTYAEERASGNFLFTLCCYNGTGCNPDCSAVPLATYQTGTIATVTIKGENVEFSRNFTLKVK